MCATGTQYEKVTPLMLASARGSLGMVRLLIKFKAKIEKPDKFKRTAVTHAAMNGATNVLSYLLSLGKNTKNYVICLLGNIISNSPIAFSLFLFLASKNVFAAVVYIWGFWHNEPF